LVYYNPLYNPKQPSRFFLKKHHVLSQGHKVAPLTQTGRKEIEECAPNQQGNGNQTHQWHSKNPWWVNDGILISWLTEPIVSVSPETTIPLQHKKKLAEGQLVTVQQFLP